MAEGRGRRFWIGLAELRRQLPGAALGAVFGYALSHVVPALGALESVGLGPRITLSVPHEVVFLRRSGDLQILARLGAEHHGLLSDPPEIRLATARVVIGDLDVVLEAQEQAKFDTASATDQSIITEPLSEAGLFLFGDQDYSVSYARFNEGQDVAWPAFVERVRRAAVPQGMTVEECHKDLEDPTKSVCYAWIRVDFQVYGKSKQDPIAQHSCITWIHWGRVDALSATGDGATYNTRPRCNGPRELEGQTGQRPARGELPKA